MEPTSFSSSYFHSHISITSQTIYILCYFTVIRASHDMQQRIVIKLKKKSQEDRAKAMEIATRATRKVAGDVTVKFEGEEKDKLVVIGNGIDGYALTKLLRKKLDRDADLEEVE